MLSTLHTNDAPSSITRLLDLKVPGFLISSTVLGILAQRLVRVICHHCLEEYAPTREEALALGLPFEVLSQSMLKRGRGCLHCRQTGFSGRDGIFEILPITEPIRRLISEQADSPALFKAGREAGMVPARIDRPPTTIITTPMAPMTIPPNDVTAEMPVSVVRTFENSFSTPVSKTLSSRSSAI